MKNYAFLVSMYYTHPGYWTSIFGTNCAYYIGIFTVMSLKISHMQICKKTVGFRQHSDSDSNSDTSLVQLKDFCHYVLSGYRHVVVDTVEENSPSLNVLFAVSKTRGQYSFAAVKSSSA